MRVLRRGLGRWAGILLLAAAAGFLVLRSGAGIGVDRRIAELRDRLRAHPATGEVHLVEIDARSITALRRWPWPRSLHGAAVDRLREAGVRSIAFDVDFSSVSAPAEDASFAAALARAGGGVILPSFTQDAGSGDGASIDAAPIPPLADNAFLATANVDPDEDGALRRMPFGGETLGIPRPSLASLVAERTDSVGDSFGIDYSIDVATIPRHSFVDLIEGRVPRAALAGRRIIIGATAVELGDRYGAPGQGVLPGAVIQALAADTLIAGSEREAAGPMLPLLFALLVVALAAAGRPRPLCAAGVAAAALILPAASYAADARLALAYEIVPALAALAVAGAAMGAVLWRHRDRELSLRDGETRLPNLAALAADAAALPSARIVVARLSGYGALAAALGPQPMARLVISVAERLRLGSGAERIYRSDESGLAWIVADDETSEASMDGLAALVRDQQAGGRRIELPLHFGLAAGPGASARRVAANAALAAAQAERSGERWQTFTERDSAEVSRSVSLMGELDEGFRSGAIRNHYQPKLDLASGRITGVEALVRWHHPQRGLLAPDAFLALIEEHGRARDLTVHVLREALARAAAWRAEGLDLGIAVNVTASLLGDLQFMAELRRIVADSGVPADRLTIEVTETGALAHSEAAIAALEAWRTLGAGVSIDDFGTGQSSLGYIRMLPATELKIDRSFVTDLDSSPRNAIMVRSTIAMAHELGLKVVAEGIEEPSCLATLAAMGCDVGQGYLIGRPVPGEEIAACVRRHDEALEIQQPAQRAHRSNSRAG